MSGTQRKKNGLLAGATPERIQIGDLPVPVTIVFKSSAPGRALQLQFDDGMPGAAEFFTPVLDQTSATQLVLHLNTPVTHVRLTGVANDSWQLIYCRDPD